MNKTKKLAKNYLYNLIYQILVIILPLITTPYVSRVLGATNIGIYSFTLSISAYFILFGTLGTALYGQREIAFNQDSKEKYSKTFWEIFILRLVTMLISILIFSINFMRNTEYSIYYRILGLELLGNIFDISWLFQGLEEFKKTVTRNTIVKIISVISIFVFVKTENDLFIYFLIYVLSLIIGNLSLWLYLPKYLIKVSLKDLNIMQHFKPTIALFIPQIAVQVYTLLDKTMIGIIVTDKSEVGFYEQSQKIVKILLTIVTSLGTVMMPRIANSFSNGEEEKVKNYMYKSFNLVFLISFPLIFGLIAIAKDFVPIFFGDGYDKVSILMSIISPILLIIGISNVIGVQYLLPTKRQKEYTISVISGAVINFILNSFLIYKYGAIGASIATVIAELTVTGVQINFVRKDFKFYEIIKLSIKYLISAILMFLVCLIFSLALKLEGLKCIILQVIFGGLTYGICLLLMKDKFIYELIKMVLHKESNES